MINSFFQNAGRVLQDDYIPNILNFRKPTEHIHDTIFKIRDNPMHFIDVNGLKHTRKAWVPYFDDCNAIFFVASLSCYDQMLVENDQINRMVDAIQLFESLINNPLLSKPNFVLFLNKKDLFEKKIKKVPITNFFPDFQGIENVN
ncbi:hypothetical protein HDV02_003331 [Globomyces sp. JEL0801]|nr:hypothetical protein HDV02_003331 [Globomyces sp. JEL0801]